MELIHRSFLIPSCSVDLSRYHPRACLQYYIKRCLGPCVEGLTTPEAYKQAVRDVQLFLGGKAGELEAELTRRMEEAAAAELYEAAARLRDQIVTVHQMQEKQRVATAEDEDADVFGFHYENGMLAVNLFHMRGGKIVDRREMFWEELPELIDEALGEESDEPLADEEQRPGASEAASGFSAAAFFSSLLKQIYLGNAYVPRTVLVPVDFADRAVLGELLTERTGHRIEILAPQRGEKRSLVDLACLNAKQSYDQRFRVLQPSIKAIQAALQDALTLEKLPRRIECFDISHIQGTETVASMVVWEDGAMRKAEYRKFQVKTVTGVDDFASMREVVGRRYKRLLKETKAMPSLILIDGGVGQLHAAYDALAEIGIQPGVPGEPALVVDCQARGGAVRAWAGARAGGAGAALAGAAPGADDPRREPSLRGDVPPQAARDARPRQ